MHVLTYSPGQRVTLFLEIKDNDGYYVDGYSLPEIFRLIKPDLTLDGYYPQPMHKFDTGIYHYSFTLPTGASAVGSYFVNISYLEKVTYLTKFESYLLLVKAPFGLYSATSF